MGFSGQFIRCLPKSDYGESSIDTTNGLEHRHRRKPLGRGDEVACTRCGAKMTLLYGMSSLRRLPLHSGCGGVLVRLGETGC